mmetsp:Transcript_31310/g.62543  ORF Transcript_31310/g.62543 Transcript_31310/m.62543 type:complete len:96 (+) Transcript_31310:185-472(+)
MPRNGAAAPTAAETTPMACRRCGEKRSVPNHSQATQESRCSGFHEQGRLQADLQPLLSQTLSGIGDEQASSSLGFPPIEHILGPKRLQQKTSRAD